MVRKKLGVDLVIDYQTTRFEDVVHKADVVLDTRGGEVQQRSWRTLKPGGILVSIVSAPSSVNAVGYEVRSGVVWVKPSATPDQKQPGYKAPGFIPKADSGRREKKAPNRHHLPPRFIRGVDSQISNLKSQID